jgi:hypothetical protein
MKVLIVLVDGHETDRENGLFRHGDLQRRLVLRAVEVKRSYPECCLQERSTTEHERRTARQAGIAWMAPDLPVRALLPLYTGTTRI